MAFALGGFGMCLRRRLVEALEPSKESRLDGKDGMIFA